MTTLLHPPSGPAPMSFDVSRRRSSAVSTASSNSIRRASVVSLNLMSHSRQPLAPLGPQITPACAFADASSIHDSSPDAKPRSRQSFSDDSLPDYSNPLDITKLHSRKARYAPYSGNGSARASVPNSLCIYSAVVPERAVSFLRLHGCRQLTAREGEASLFSPSPTR